MYTHICICIYTYIHIYTYICTYLNMCIYDAVRQHVKGKSPHQAFW